MLQLILQSIKLVPGQFRGRLIFLQFILLLSACLELLGVVSVGPFIALAMNPSHVHENQHLLVAYQWMGAESEAQFLAWVGLLFGILFIGSNAVLLATQVYLVGTSNKLQAELVSRIYRYFLRQNYLYHVRHRPGTLISKINSDTSRLCNGLILAILQINARLFSIIILIALLFVVNWVAALSIGGAVVGAYGLVYFMSNHRLKTNGLERTVNDRARSRLLQETFEGIKTLQSYELESGFSERLNETSKERVRINISDKLLKDLPYFAIESVAFSMIVVMTLFVFTESGRSEAAIAQLAIICLAGYRLIPKFQQVYRSIASIKTNQHALKQLYKDLSKEDPEPAQLTAKGSLGPDVEGEFKLAELGFTYEGSQVVFQGVNFHISPGEFVGITGASGAGKSTLMALMSGLLEPESGQLSYGGVTIGRDNKRVWKKMVGYVDADVYLFEGTLKSNILLGRDMDGELLEELLQATCLDQVVSGVAGGLEGDLGSKGGRLSSGQRQRVGFARALYGNPRVLLLDEATNALDFQTQQEILSNIRKKWPHLSVVVISHRVDMLDNLDRFYCLKDGCLIEAGGDGRVEGEA
ncbi:ABC transporter ATP-binding protein [Pseudomaricurvus sp. HS19]|uniref:ABC transporter ATP-binding protein n=1 Tax=Pseudomaricurvus sp. HS19 TaxID=2692626 RepID=UPI00136A3B0E|nr:ABC transporter ATP-binding protein [Pseudomaricurvus sp. HS19]MYM64707.1 ATP-binding cassette domain-containing protein [Pseudomaricurvus sp. HS19]